MHPLVPDRARPRPATAPTRILIVDDHPIVRAGLCAVVDAQDDMRVVAEAAGGVAAVEMFRRLQPDIVLMDLRMPVMDGVEATAAIRAEFPEARIVILTTSAGDEDIDRALHAGARAYVLKDAEPGALLAAIRTVSAGGRHSPPEVSSRPAQHIGGSALTPRELEVLRCIVGGKKNKAIAELLGVTVGTVKGHINNILGKLGVRDRTQAATTAIQRGLVRLE